MRASRDTIKHDRKDELASHYFSSSREFHLRFQNKNSAIMHSAQDTLANASDRQLPTARLGHNGPLVTRLGYGLMGLVSVTHRLFSRQSLTPLLLNRVVSTALQNPTTNVSLSLTLHSSKAVVSGIPPTVTLIVKTFSVCYLSHRHTVFVPS